jgi:hypothetical protein
MIWSSRYASHVVFLNILLVIKVPFALVLELIDLGSILAGGFLEGHDFTTRHGIFGGRPP